MILPSTSLTGHGDGNVDQLAVFALAHGVEGRDPLSAPQAGDDAGFLFVAIGAHQERDGLADGLFCGVAEDPLGPLVPTRDDPVEGLADDGVVRKIDHEGKALRRRHGLLQLLVGHSRGLAREQRLIGRRRGEFGEVGHDPQVFGVEALGFVVRNDPDRAHGLVASVERHEQRVLDRRRELADVRKVALGMGEQERLVEVEDRPARPEVARRAASGELGPSPGNRPPMKSLSLVGILEQAHARGMGLAQFKRRFRQGLKDVSGRRRQHFGELDQGGIFRFMVRFSRWKLAECGRSPYRNKLGHARC